VLNITPNRSLDEPPFAAGQTSTFDWDARLSIDVIRAHAKIDDVPAVLDEQLRLYRASGIESAEHYTGLLLSGQRTITEPVEGPSRVRPWRTTYIHRLRYPVADGYIYLYGGTHVNDNVTVPVPPGTRSVKVPIRIGGPDLTNCCDPCAKPFHLNGGMMVAYKAGFKCIDDIPAGIIHGLLQFLAWCIEHPGDELLTQRNRVETRAGLAGLQGSNNIAMISGALETWVKYDDERV
jgi:hypothetical protein